MANFLMPKGQLLRDESPVASDALVGSSAEDVTFERRTPTGGDRSATSLRAASPSSWPTPRMAASHCWIRRRWPSSAPSTSTVRPRRSRYATTAPMSVSRRQATTPSWWSTSTPMSVTASFPLSAGVTALAVGPDGKRVYAGGNSGDRVLVSVIDVPAERVGTIDIGRAPAANIDALCVDARGKRLSVGATDDRGSQLLVVDTETARTRAVVPLAPRSGTWPGPVTRSTCSPPTGPSVAPSMSSTHRRRRWSTRDRRGRPDPDHAESRRGPRVCRRLRPGRRTGTP